MQLAGRDGKLAWRVFIFSEARLVTMASGESRLGRGINGTEHPVVGKGEVVRVALLGPHGPTGMFTR